MTPPVWDCGSCASAPFCEPTIVGQCAQKLAPATHTPTASDFNLQASSQFVASFLGVAPARFVLVCILPIPPPAPSTGASVQCGPRYPPSQRNSGADPNPKIRRTNSQ